MQQVAAKAEGYDAADLRVLADRALHAAARRHLAAGSGLNVQGPGAFTISPEDLAHAEQGFQPAADWGVGQLQVPLTPAKTLHSSAHSCAVLDASCWLWSGSCCCTAPAMLVSQAASIPCLQAAGGWRRGGRVAGCRGLGRCASSSAALELPTKYAALIARSLSCHVLSCTAFLGLSCTIRANVLPRPNMPHHHLGSSPHSGDCHYEQPDLMLQCLPTDCT